MGYSDGLDKRENRSKRRTVANENDSCLLRLRLIYTFRCRRPPSDHEEHDHGSALLRPLAYNGYDWNPEPSSSGPITIVVSAADRAFYVYRNGNPIGLAAVEIDGRGSLGDHIYSLLESTTDRQSSLAPGRAARRWMSVTSRGRSVPAEKIAERLRINPEFAQKVYDTLQSGTTVIITDQPVVRSRGNAVILEG